MFSSTYAAASFSNFSKSGTGGLRGDAGTANPDSRKWFEFKCLHFVYIFNIHHIGVFSITNNVFKNTHL
jgi:hypothetical protein